MLLASLVALPFLAAVAAILMPWDTPRRALLALAPACHLGLCLLAAATRPVSAFPDVIALDDLGVLFLCLSSVLFTVVSFYAVGYLRSEPQGERRDFASKAFFVNAPERVFSACLLAFLGCMTLVTITSNLGLLWAAVEANALTAAPLIYFHRHQRSLEATWKYLMICSVGIALALLGNIFLSASLPSGIQGSLALTTFLANATGLDPTWLRLGFFFALAGYGTKMGLAPMHSWLPDAHSEAPSLVSALLSGAQLNCAFLGILRVYQIMGAAGLSGLCQPALAGLGVVSLLFAAVFILGQGDFKRLLAYSSVEHMGILSLALGLGQPAHPAMLLHMTGHSLTKAMLFLMAGNILAGYHSKSAHDVRGVIRLMPVTGVLWLLGFLAICGSPPFSLFVSELGILKAAMDAERYVLAATFLILLFVIFVGMATPVLRMAQGYPPPSAPTTVKVENTYSLAPAVALAGLVTLLGVWVPGPVWTLMRGAAACLGGN
ncbi:proton-conducting transporter membrane subunit [Fundidesulfovibrio butyratiphilus]